MPVDEFTNEAYKGLASGIDQVNVGAMGPPETFNDIVDKRKSIFDEYATRMRAMRGEK